MKKPKSKTKPEKTPAKKHRTRIDSRIAAAKTDGERRCLAMYGQKTWPSRIQILVDEWAFVNFLRDNPEMLKSANEGVLEFWKANQISGDFDKHPAVDRLLRAQENGMKFIRDAMLTWDGDSLIALGKELKRAAAAAAEPKQFDLDRHRRSLLACGISPSKAARAILEKVRAKGQDKYENEKRQLQRIQARWRKGDS